VLNDPVIRYSVTDRRARLHVRASSQRGLPVPPSEIRRRHFSYRKAITTKVHPGTSPIRASVPTATHVRPAAIQIPGSRSVATGVSICAMWTNLEFRGMGRPKRDC
jgi:hypothetical protein